MSHNINKRNGVDSFYSVREKAWHNLGQIVPEHLPMMEAMKLANADYTVEKVDNLYVAKDGSLKGTPRNSFFTIRTDTDTPLGVVGDDYTVMQNLDVIGSLEAIAGDIKIETIGVLGAGEIVFATCRLPEDYKIAGDAYQGYFVVMNTHDGSGKAKWFITPIRVVCQNTLNMALGNYNRMHAISHHKHWQDRLVHVRKNLELTQVYYKSFAEVCEALAKQKFSEANFGDLFDKLYGVPDDDAGKRAQTLYERERTNAFTAYNADDLNNIRHTKLGAYNAIADYSDHYRELRGSRKDEKAYLRTFINTKMKDQAFELLRK